ncbi:hypothetical protein SRHO_G00070640 [Serrasalmus rhombeus]
MHARGQRRAVNGKGHRAIADGGPKAPLHKAPAATAPAEPEGELRAAAGQRSTDSHQSFAKTKVKTMAGVISRYKKALKYYKEAGSIQRAFDCLGADRNTVACTAPITELSIASPDVFANLPPWNDKSLLRLQIHAILRPLQTSKNK